MMKVTRREILVIITLIIIAVARFLFFLPKAPDFGTAIGQTVSVEGVVSDTPDIRLNNKRLTLTPINQKAHILAVVDKYAEVEYGDKVKVTGVLETPENFMTSSGKEFNYQRYLANQDIYFIIKNAKMEIISHGHGNFIKSFLFKIRNSFIENIRELIFSPESDLAGGLVLGERGGFDSAMRDEFINTGTIHIIALSGYNVTIVAESIIKLLGLALSQTLSLILGILIIILFVVMAGSSSTAIRAGVMATIALFARLTGRTYDAGRALVVAGLVMIAVDLRVLADISFQLSFIATFGVLFLTPKVIGWVRVFPMRFGFREIVATTIAATIAVLPLLLYSTGILSLVSLPANILILPIIPLTMLFSFLAGLISFLSPVIALPFAYIAHLFLKYILSVIHFFASVPFASVTIKSFPIIITILLYALLLWWVFRKVDELS